MITVDLDPAPASASSSRWPILRRAVAPTSALFALLVILAVAHPQPAALSKHLRDPLAPEEKKFTVMPLRFGVNPSITTSGGSITMSPDIALEGGFIGWEGETYGAEYDSSNVAGPGNIGERDAQIQGQALAVNDKPLGETAAIVGSGVFKTASALDRATASAMINTWEAPGRVVGAEFWAAGAVANMAFAPFARHMSPLPPMPAAPPAPPSPPPSPPARPPASPQPARQWFWG
jgi:hypothetical protein